MTITKSEARRVKIAEHLARTGRAVSSSELSRELDIPKASVTRLLTEMASSGEVEALPDKFYRSPRPKAPEKAREEDGTYEGVLTVHPRGFGFVASSGMTDDLFIGQSSMRGAMHGDKVRVRVVSRSRRGAEGEITEILHRRSTRVAGLLRKRGRSAWLEPDDTRMRGPIVINASDGQPIPGRDGDAAVAEITRFPEWDQENPEGVILAVLGRPGDANVEVAKILMREGIDEAHPAAAVEEARSYGDEVPREALRGREDLTHIPLPTIDPADARDHDDAVWAERLPDGSFKAWIAIADVSHYVRPDTALDASALARGNSIYLPDRAIPMLPRELSSNLCSLLPHVIRLCLCVEILLDSQGNVVKSRVIEGYMRSAAKLNYAGVARALGFTKLPPKSPEAEAMRGDLQVLADLATLLRNARMRRGAMDFDLPEPHVILDEETGAPVAVERRAHDPGVKKAYQLIEEMMLLANETVARMLVDKGVPTVFRDHAKPDAGKLDRLSALCEELGLHFDPEDALEPKRLKVFLHKVAAHEKRDVLNMLMLRSMKQATYDVDNIGHFGLASDAYLHFTSPIRRYPDVLVHRAVRSLVRKERIDKSDTAIERMRSSAVTASLCERRGMEVEREVLDLYRALYMRQHLGEVFEGTVTALVGTGAYVAIPEPFVDVLVRMESLGPDGYELDDQGLRLVGIRSGERIAIGDKMRVQIEDVAVLRRSIYGRRLVDATSVATGSPRRKSLRQGSTRPGAPERAAGRASERAPEPAASPSAVGSRRRSLRSGSTQGRGLDRGRDRAAEPETRLAPAAESKPKRTSKTSKSRAEVKGKRKADKLKAKSAKPAKPTAPRNKAKSAKASKPSRAKRRQG